MMHRLQHLREWLPLFPLLLLLAATYWLNQQVLPLPYKPSSTQLHAPDFVISEIAATTLNEKGEPRFVLAAQKVAHYPSNDSTVLDNPRLTSLHAGQPLVYTTARQGEISSNGDEIFLRGDVKLIRNSGDTQSEMIFTTDFLHVIPDRDLADTGYPVTIKDARSSIHAVGMQLDNNARVIKLLSQVKSQHETSKK